MDTIQLSSEIRTQTGKGSVRKLRSTGKLPAILYGPETDTIMLTLDCTELEKALKEKSAESVLLDLRIDSGKKGQSKKVMIKEVQRDPVTRDYLHIDLFEISLKKELEVEIPIHLVNTPIGQSLHIGDISFPSGLKSLEDADVTVLTVVAPRVDEVEEVEGEEVEEERVEETEGEEPKSEEES
jgi:large subunit ribosomal protein L25